MRFEIDGLGGTVSLDGGPSLPLPWSEASGIERLVLDSETGRLQVGLPGLAALAEVETLASAESVDALRAGRPFLYLDQNQWRKIADCLHGERVSGGDASAAEEIIRRTRDGELLCPLSAAHGVESDALTGDLRRQVVVAMIAVSRGWLMRSPLQVRGDEALSVLTGGRAPRPAVFSPNAQVFTESTRPHPIVAPPGIQRLIAEVQEILSIYEAMLGDDPVPVSAAVSQRWADHHAGLAAETSKDGASPAVIRRAAGAWVILSMLDKSNAAGLLAGVSRFRTMDLLVAADREGGKAPFSDLLAEVLFHRVRNATQHWEPNDFLDTMFLACGGGYADVVVTERNAANYLRQSARARRCAAVATSLEQALEHLDALPHAGSGERSAEAA